jgi:2-methylisocitrate lyase-like PEP mutase family enzyme
VTGAADFLELHHGQGFVLPNAWDPGSARLLEQCGFPALATTSAGIAFALGRPDASVDGDRMLEHVARIVESVAVPVTADLEAGYGESPEAVARTVARVVDLGAVGANLEDQVGGELFEVGEAAARIAAARDAAPKGTFVINARTDTYFGAGTGDVFEATVERATRYVEAGADCVFVPGVDEAETIRRLAAEIPAPLNIVAGLAATRLDAPTLFSLGVKRISLGGSIARAAFSLVERAGRELLESGTLGFLDGAISYAELQRRFGS